MKHSKTDYEFTREEVALILGISPSRVDSIQKQALEKIGKQLEDLGINLE